VIADEAIAQIQIIMATKNEAKDGATVEEKQNATPDESVASGLSIKKLKKQLAKDAKNGEAIAIARLSELNKAEAKANSPKEYRIIAHCTQVIPVDDYIRVKFIPVDGSNAMVFAVQPKYAEQLSITEDEKYSVRYEQRTDKTQYVVELDNGDFEIRNHQANANNNLTFNSCEVADAIEVQAVLKANARKEKLADALEMQGYMVEQFGKLDEKNPLAPVFANGIATYWASR
jgi:hypothetical protein